MLTTPCNTHVVTDVYVHGLLLRVIQSLTAHQRCVATHWVSERGSPSAACQIGCLILAAASNLTYVSYTQSRQSMSIFSDFCAIFCWAGLTGIGYVSTVHYCMTMHIDSSWWTQWLGSHPPHPTHWNDCSSQRPVAWWTQIRDCINFIRCDTEERSHQD